MPSKRNEQLLSQMNGFLKEYDDFFITENNGLSVGDLVQLRKKLRESGSVYHIVKNRLFKIALAGKKIGDLDQFFIGSSGVLFTKDSIKAAKVVDNFVKEHKEKLKVKAGFSEGKIVDESHIKNLASLLSKEELIGKLMFIMKNPVQKIAFVLGQVAEQKESRN
jgi:large subunit ribosomal protein L10